MVMLVLVSAVTLSPMVMVIALRSWASIILGSSEVSTAGFKGSMEGKRPRDTTNWYIEST